MKNKRFFYDRWFNIEQGVFRPRPETERLIELTKRFFDALVNKKKIDILEIGTGSGVISIILSKIYRCAKILAIDVSKKALKCSKDNFENIGGNNVEFRESDLFSGIKKTERFDLIISNPPYVSDEFELSEDVRKNDPKKALFGGVDGLDLIKKIISVSQQHLKKEFLIALEIGFDQKEKIIDFLQDYQDLFYYFERDYNDHYRYLFLYKRSLKPGPMNEKNKRT